MAVHIPSDIAIRKRICGASSVGTVPMIDPHSLQTRLALPFLRSFTIRPTETPSPARGRKPSRAPSNSGVRLPKRPGTIPRRTRRKHRSGSTSFAVKIHAAWPLMSGRAQPLTGAGWTLARLQLGSSKRQTVITKSLRDRLSGSTAYLVAARESQTADRLEHYRTGDQLLGI